MISNHVYESSFITEIYHIAKKGKLEILHNYQNVTQTQEVSKYCWKNGTDRLAPCKVTTSLQFVKKKNSVKHYISC